ncbi:unnamed protein product [Cylicostephanus goldi]|uniref:Uncharacterized protein n=1 Tax=Cylicostephanus goldi TaxID=71465 RepID=A0A3P6RKE7_CYLGO|nr:unnamed protein product [Cylicostephanus goldi]
MDSCCRSLLPSVDWNMACASSAKYHWEDEEKKDEHEAESEGRRRRSHWTEEVLAATNQCIAVRNGSLRANTVLSRCCANFEDFSQLELTRVQRSVARSHEYRLASYNLHAREVKVADLCMRGRLHEYMKYPTINEVGVVVFPSPKVIAAVH